MTDTDELLAAAVDVAREAAIEAGGDGVGEYIGAVAEGDLVVTHAFASTLPGYVGWYWAAILVRAPGSHDATVADVVLLPGPDALLAPEWVPWSERLQPGDLGPGDLLPPEPNDPRLVPAYIEGDDRMVESVAFELGLGRERVLSRGGRLNAAERWFVGDFGPDTPMARHAPAPCGTCGFLLTLAGALQAGFGVCGNEISSADGRVVSVEYGCGAHSQLRVRPAPLSEPNGEIIETGDDYDVEANQPLEANRSLEANQSSAGAALAPVLDDQHQADEAEDAAVQTSPEPDAVAVLVEPAPEAAEHDGEREPDDGAN